MNLREDVKRYTQLFGPSGEEDRVITAFAKDLQTLGYTPVVDALGNVTTSVSQGESRAKHVVVSAHLDEIGFVVRKVDPDGFCYVMVGSRDELAALGVTVGSLGTYVGPYQERGDFVSAKALDNRAGVAMLLELARRLQKQTTPCRVTLLATVQEEFSVRGGIPAVRRLAPDLAFCLDIAIATDTPDLRHVGDVFVGRGPVISRFTRAGLNGVIPNPKLRALVAKVAEKADIPYEYGVMQGGLTDGSFMQYEADGVPTLDLSFATRYTHTAVETCSFQDLLSNVELLEGSLQEVTASLDLSRGNTN